MISAAGACPNLHEIEDATVIDAIGRTLVDVALLIHQYADASIRGKASTFGESYPPSYRLLGSNMFSGKARGEIGRAHV